MTRSRRNHVFVLRHCTRATYPDVEVYVPHKGMYTTKVPPADQSNYRDPEIEKLDAQDFIDSPMPDFGVPTRWCLPRSLENIQGNGRDIMRKILASRKRTDDDSDSNEKRIIKFEIITDTYIRNVDSAYYFSLGIREEAEKHKDRVIAKGFENIKVDHFPFHPIDKVFFDNTICSFSYTGERFNNDLRKRLETVPSPPLNYSFELMKRIGGVGRAGPLSLVAPAGQITVNPFDHELEGVVNILKLFGQMMFYSRCGGIEPPFLPNATLKETYFMASWINYIRSILNLENVHSATTGGMLGNLVMRELGNNDDQHLDYDDKVTIYMAHDGNVDDMATVFGMRWILPPPYHQDIAEYLPTPSGSGVQFTHHIDSGTAEVSFLYTTFLNPPRNESEKFWHNDTGIMDSIPVIFLPNDADAAFSVSNSKSALKISHRKDIKVSGIHLLQLRLLSTFDRYPEARECYDAVTKLEDQKLTKFSNGGNSGSYLSSTFFVLFLLVLGCMVIFRTWFYECQGAKKGKSSESETLLKVSSGVINGIKHPAPSLSVCKLSKS